MFICFNEGTVSKENFQFEAMISELCTRKREPPSSIQACYVDSLQSPEVSMANLAKFVSRKREPRSSIQACYVDSLQSLEVSMANLAKCVSQYLSDK